MRSKYIFIPIILLAIGLVVGLNFSSIKQRLPFLRESIGQGKIFFLEEQKLKGYQYGQENEELVSRIYSYDLEDKTKVKIHEIAAPSHLASTMSAKLSPDKKVIAYSSIQGVFLYDLESKKEKKLVDNFESLGDPAKARSYYPISWSPDGNWLLLEVRLWEMSSLAVVNRDDSTPRSIYKADGEEVGCDSGTDWSPDSKYIVIAGLGYGHPCSNIPGLHLVEIKKNGQLTLKTIYSERSGTTDYPFSPSAATPDWSEDSKKILFVRQILPEDGEPLSGVIQRVSSITPDGEELTDFDNLNAGFDSDIMAGWLSENELLIADKSAISVYNTKSEKKRKLYENGISPMFSSLSEKKDYAIISYYLDEDRTNSVDLVLKISNGTFIEIPRDSQNSNIKFVGWYLK